MSAQADRQSLLPVWEARIPVLLLAIVLVCDWTAPSAAHGAENNASRNEASREPKEPSAKDKDKAAALVRQLRGGIVFVKGEFSTVRRRRIRNYDSLPVRNAFDSYYRTVAMASDAGDVDAAIRQLLASLREACKSDLAAVKGRLTYDFFRRQVEQAELVRGEFIKAIDKALR